MKKTCLVAAAAGFLFLGCADKPMATSVIDMAGNQKVLGWNENNASAADSNCTKTIIKYKTVVKYKTEKDSDGDWVPDSVDKCPNTPPNTAVDHNGCPIVTTLRFNFDFNKAVVKKIYYPQIAKIARILKDNPQMKIEIAGHTDDIGSDEYNLKLSQKRAEAVKEILVKKYGIDPSRIIARGYGEKYPLVPNTSSTNRALNRRVEIVNITTKQN